MTDSLLHILLNSIFKKYGLFQVIFQDFDSHVFTISNKYVLFRDLWINILEAYSRGAASRQNSFQYSIYTKTKKHYCSLIVTSYVLYQILTNPVEDDPIVTNYDLWGRKEMNKKLKEQ